jgi:hypothetical protein
MTSLTTFLAALRSPIGACALCGALLFAGCSPGEKKPDPEISDAAGLPDSSALHQEHASDSRSESQGVEHLLPALEMEGFRRSGALPPYCDFDQECPVLDGLHYVENEGRRREIALTNLALLNTFLKKSGQSHSLKGSADLGGLADGGLFTDAVIQEADFISFGEVAIAKPEGLDFVSVLVGYNTNGGMYEAPVSAAYALVGRDSLVFLIDLKVEAGAFPKIPACNARFHEHLKQRDIVCDPDCYSIRAPAEALNEADAAYQRCYVESFPSTSHYPAFGKDVEDLLRRLAAAR